MADSFSLSSDIRPIVIIGAGSTGASTVYHLAKMGHKVALIDKGQPASGMTSRSTALVRNHYSNEIVAQMAHYSLQMLRNFAEVGNSGFTANGMIFLGNQESRKSMDLVLPNLARAGVKTERLESREAAKRFPELSLDDDEFVDYEPESGYADPVSTTNSYVSKARELGAEILSGLEVSRLCLDGTGRLDSVELVGGERIHCSKAVLCTNVWTNRLMVSSNVVKDSLPIWSAAHPVIIMRRPSLYEGLKPNIADLPNKTYCKPEGKTLLFGGSLDPEFDLRKADPDSTFGEVPFEFLNFFSEVISRRIPSMREGVVHSSYVGMYDMTPDQHPIVDDLSQIGLSGAFCCVGLSGHGFKLCPALGLMIAEMVCGKESPTFDWNHFSLGRFKKGKLLSSRFTSVNTIA